jgi:hypothetical protein
VWTCNNYKARGHGDARKDRTQKHYTVGMRHIVLAGIVLLACAPKKTTEQAEVNLILTAGYQGGLVPAQVMFRAPELVILKNGGVFKLSEEDDLCRYAGVLPEDRARIAGFANRLWESGLEGGFSVAEGVTDLPSLVIRMKEKAGIRQISIHGYPMGRLKEKGGEYVDSIMAAAQSATTTREEWVPYDLELRVMSWLHDTTGWRVYDWEGPDLPLDSLAEGFWPMELRGDTASAVRDYLAGKTIYTRRDMALFRKGEKIYAIAILPLVY